MALYEIKRYRLRRKVDQREAVAIPFINRVPGDLEALSRAIGRPGISVIDRIDGDVTLKLPDGEGRHRAARRLTPGTWFFLSGTHELQNVSAGMVEAHYEVLPE
jgi:hypothetical protein